VTEPELAPGDSGEWVERLQTRLQTLGRYTGAVDGHYGEQTETAVLDIQREKGLTADGKVGLQTWAVLGELAPGDVSEDLLWRWTGAGWEAVEPQTTVAVAEEEPLSGGDGQWLWDGSKWQPVDG
jgi:hypothetical protein